MGLFSKNKDNGGAALTAEDIAHLRALMEESRKASDPFTGKDALKTTTIEDGEKKKVEIPKITHIHVDKVPEKPKEKKSVGSIMKTLLMLLGACAAGIVVVAAGLALLTIVTAGAMGAVMMYVIGFYGFLGVALITILVFFYYRTRMAPVWNYNACVNHPGKSLMLLMRKTGVASLEVSRYVAETFEKEANPAKQEDPLAFFKTDKSPSILGRAGFGVFYDAANVMANPEFVLACNELQRLGYTHIEQAKEDWMAGKLSVNIPLFAEVDFGSLYDFVIGRPAISKAYCDTKVNEARAERDQKWYQDKGLIALGFFVMMVLVGIGMAWAMTHGFSFG